MKRLILIVVGLGLLLSFINQQGFAQNGGKTAVTQQYCHRCGMRAEHPPALLHVHGRPEHVEHGGTDGLRPGHGPDLADKRGRIIVRRAHHGARAHGVHRHPLPCKPLAPCRIL